MIKKIFFIISALILAALIVVGFFVYRGIKNGSLQEAVIQRVERQIVSKTDDEPIFEKLLGFEKPMTYLVLLMNNTEIRPAGGFIGAYAIVKVSHGIPEIVKIEGSESLDNSAPKDFPSPPPAPIASHLKLDRWYFRDSNWSPDFARASADSLRLYTLERGVDADSVDAVVGFTPTIIEELLKKTGPLTVNGQSYTSENFTEKTEYAVEYGYASEGIPFSERKKLLGDLAVELIRRLGPDIFFNSAQYIDLATAFIAERQLAFYSPDADLQRVFTGRGWSGEMNTTTKDYVMWVDANLGALKTDVAVRKSLSYVIAPTSSGQFEGRITMRYTHEGTFNWRTTRYLTYARVYVPVGSRLVSSSGSKKGDRQNEPGVVDQGIENGRQWFGAFTYIEPGTSGDLSFTFLLSPQITDTIRAGSYDVFVQKQLGSVGTALTTRLDFGRRVVAAHPGEPAEKHGDSKYEIQLDLDTSKDIGVTLLN